MTTRKIIAATILGLLGGTAIAYERQIDYTNEHLTMTRAEVLAESRAFTAAHGDFLAATNETYGRFEPASSMPAQPDRSAFTTRGSRDVRGDEAYGGFPQVDDRLGRGE